MTPSVNIDTVTEKFGNLPYMKPKQAAFLKQFIVNNNVTDILELGFFHGKSTAYFAAILEENGKGHITTIDLRNAARRSPSIIDVLAQLNLEHRVTPIFAPRSFTWEMQKMLSDDPIPQFDFIYIDGGHTWDGTGFGFFLLHNPVQTEVSELAPDARASAFSLHALSFYTGQALGPILYGAGAQTIGLPASLVIGACGFLVAGLGAWCLLREAPTRGAG